MAKQPSLKDRVFVSKVSKTASGANSHRAIIPNELLTKLKIAMGDQLCWKLDETGKKISIWKRTKKDRNVEGSSKNQIIDIKEVTPVKTDMKKVSLSTDGAETQPQITSTSHI